MRDLTGTWHGTFRYLHGLGPDTPFLATINDRAGLLVGTIIEPNEFVPAETAVASLAGCCAGISVDFTKIYHGAGRWYEDPVDYIGRLSEDGNSVIGMWNLAEFDGTFEMFREDGLELLEAKAEHVEAIR